MKTVVLLRAPKRARLAKGGPRRREKGKQSAQSGQEGIDKVTKWSG